MKGCASVVSEIALVGAACKLPGAPSIDALWSLLSSGRNVIRPRPEGRWSVDRFLRAGEPEPGFAYTFAGGYIAAPFSFDPAPFGLSPREAQQMDPQQRLLLETTWRALEDARIPPSSLAGRNVGVYVGASMVDYQSGASHDPAVMGSHFMTGNSLSILSNRLSYVFDLRGPSFTLDSACSSSLVALTEAVAALRNGRIEMAIVGGVNLLLSPAPFIGFSQARMLSPTGLSRPFSQDADGYVRSEGAVVLILRRLDEARTLGETVKGAILAAAVNSDGRKAGISLPSLEGQRSLITQVYADAGVSPDDLAFIEAHGTGTKVGDPIEAAAIGDALGRFRQRPLPIGSIKSNIGHLEAASGLAGLLKACLALRYRRLPKSLFSDRLSEAIDFGGLNLSPAQAERDLGGGTTPLMAGVCNYGFGGANAHVILRGPDPQSVRAAPSLARPVQAGGRILLLSAATRPALAQRAQQVAGLLESGTCATDIARALAHHHDIFPLRLAAPLDKEDTLASRLRRFAGAASGAAEDLRIGNASTGASPTAFVFSGNGSQFSRMGQGAYRNNALFRAEIDDIDAQFQSMAGWSIADAVRDGVAADQLAQTSIAQPLIFAVQSALLACLAASGFRPDAVLGHSVGEVAAAEACGALSRMQALRLIHLRSKHQETVRGEGRMLVIAADARQTAAQLRSRGLHQLEIAAVNGPSSTTIVGPAEDLAKFASHCRRERIASIDIDVDYPFHSRALNRLEDAILLDLDGLAPGHAHTRLFSTVTGAELSGAQLGAAYWWRNMRNPVCFQAAVEACLDSGITRFVEIGPRPILAHTLKDIMRVRGVDGQALTSLEDSGAADRDPLCDLVAQLAAHGARFDVEAVIGTPPDFEIRVPGYPFQPQDFVLPKTAEGLRAFGALVDAPPLHPLLGFRMADDAPEWRSLIDTTLVPFLSDHLVDGGVVVPAAAFVEIIFAAARDLLGDAALQLDLLDILKPLVLQDGETREVSTRFSKHTSSLEIWSRKRFEAHNWILHARGVMRQHRGPAPAILKPAPVEACTQSSRGDVYAEARRAGLTYGDSFQLAVEALWDHDTCDAALRNPLDGARGASGQFLVHPASLDAAFHALFILRPQKDGETKPYLPIRFRNIALLRPGCAVARVIVNLTRETDRIKIAGLSLLGADGELVASIEATVFSAVYLSKASVADRTFHETLLASPPAPSPQLAIAVKRSEVGPLEPPAAWLLLTAFCVSLAHRVMKRLTDDGARDPAMLVLTGRVVSEASHYLDAVMDMLKEFGAMEACEGRLRIKPDLNLPSAEAILSTLIQRFPEAAFEIRLASGALANCEKVLSDGAFVSPGASSLQALTSRSIIASQALSALDALLEGMASDVTRKPHLLVVEPFSAGLSRAILGRVQSGDIDATFASRSGASLNAVLEDISDSRLNFLRLSETLSTPLQFDGLLSFVTRARSEEEEAALAASVRLLRKDAPVYAMRPGADAALDVLCGIWPNWFAGDAAGHGLRVPDADEISAGLGRAGVVDCRTRALGGGALVWGRAAGLERASARSCVALVAPRATAFEGGRAERFEPDDVVAVRDWVEAQSGPSTPVIVVASWNDSGEAAEALSRRIEHLRALLQILPERATPVRLVVVTCAARGGVGGQSAVEAGVRGFLRVAMNEYPWLDVRSVDLEEGVSLSVLAALLPSMGDEREWSIGAAGAAPVRVRRGLSAPQPIGLGERALLCFDHHGRLDTLRWVKAARLAPADDEIEIEIAASGLNFRDVLVGLGVLDDDLLGAGLTGGALGFECAGRVVRVGAGVTRLQAGDRVMGFAKGAFASHATAPEWQFFRFPDSMSFEAAATIPVAFATAWYALVQRAGLRAGEDVLVHGAAGGVGLAAVAIAKHVGARVIGTAGDPARRAVARAAGADRVYDSRGERFAAPIAAELGGVDVVLNSLAGSAMRTSLQLLRPFGRFIELGKRDFLDNSPLGLRPFVRNISYSGVDLDELLAHDRRTITQMMTMLSGLLASGVLRALPHEVFEPHEAVEAFRMMQGSEHVGKIVLKPATVGVPDLAALTYRVSPGLHLVVGGTRGFGFETACWLARHGATTVLLASRSGRIDDDLLPAVEAQRAAGVAVVVKQVDVSDPEAVDKLVTKACAAYGPLKGVVHAAVQLDDSLISGLDPQRLRAVLATKVDGVVNLERATADQTLDYFVVYSSATTLIGSPGQGAYVAANAFLEGWARRRRAIGKPALAIGWGAISDAGMIARDRRLAERLRRTTGVTAIRSHELLAHLGRLLALGDAADPVQVYTNISAGGAADKLSLWTSPAFSELALAGASVRSGEEGDLIERLAGKDQAQALDIVKRALAREVAQILRMPEVDVDPSRPLGDLGLDSLMGLELQLGIERLSGLQLPMIGASDRSLTDVSAAILPHLLRDGAADAFEDFDHDVAMALAGVHSAPVADEPAASAGQLRRLA